jgi:hypothetical protein
VALVVSTQVLLCFEKSKKLYLGNGQDNAQRVSNGHPSEVSYRLGDQIPLSCVERRHSTSLSVTDHTDLWRGGDKNFEGSGEQRSCLHSNWISRSNCILEVGSTDEGKDFSNVKKGVSVVGRTALGQAFLGKWLWSLEYGEYYWWYGSAIFGAPQKQRF